MRCFNTQPPEGGWSETTDKVFPDPGFNTQPPEGGWRISLKNLEQSEVSTHSRLKAAGPENRRWRDDWCEVSTHSRLKAAGVLDLLRAMAKGVSTHSRLKAAGLQAFKYPLLFISFNTQPPEGGWSGAFWISHALDCFNTQPPEGGWPYSRLTGHS